MCGTESGVAGSKQGRFVRVAFEIRQCPGCRFAYVRDPLTSPELYDEAYYRGEGADPSVDYVYELEHPARTVRHYEWKGIVQVVERLIGPRASPVRWLDYGCGTGGLVRHAGAKGFDAWGFEEGQGVEFARRTAIPLLDRSALNGAPPFDVVTAVEVLEHVFDVREVLSSIRQVLAPGGLFFYTTGNPMGRQREKLVAWSYLVPEIHVSLYEPTTMERALQSTGFRSEYVAPSRGHAEIVRYKALKGLGIKGRWPLGFPWGLRAVSPLLRAATGVLAHPVGIAV